MKSPFTKRALVAASLCLAVVGAFALLTNVARAQTGTIWSMTALPAVTSESDPASVELGVKFQTSVAGTVTGIRFYKGIDNTGTHTGTLWTNTGTELATVTFSGETASGWQEASLATPVDISPNTTYIVSYHAPNGHYAANVSYFAASSATNGPMTALKDGTDGANGVYKYSSSTAFPDASYNATNYWVDAVFSYATAVTDTTPPAVSSVTPLANATNVAVSSSLTAIFNEALDPATTAGAIELKDSAGAVISATETYDSTTTSITLHPTSPLAASTIYTATVGTSVKDVAGNALASAYTWSFTTAAAQATTVSLWAPATQTVSTAIDPGSTVTLGTRFSSDVNGSISGLSFYKSADDASQHTLQLWDTNGALMATGQTNSETASGWQTATLTTPVAITAGATYTVSYVAAAGTYSYTSASLANGFSNGQLHVPVSGGVFSYSGGMPSSVYNNTNYWVDVIFTADTQGADTTPPTVSSVSPIVGAVDVATDTAVTATFSEAVDQTTVLGALTLKDAAGQTISAAATYDAASRTVSLQPSVALANNATYTATVSTAVKDTAGNTLTTPYSWSFTTVAATTSAADMLQGAGGPILLLRSASNPFSSYYAEILRAEGLNSFTTSDVSTLSATQLAQYSVVILGDVALSDAQVGLLSDWVTAGGNLIAMHPDKKLAPLLGLIDQSSTLNDSYLHVDTTLAPGQGITDQTIQYHGPADEYSLQADTRAVATLYSSDTAATSAPAMTMRNVGTNGGQASAFTYDLAKSVVYTHQGNPAWAGQERDGSSPIRPDDLFYGAKAGDIQPDYVNLNKVAIPQADEQQRLLANTIEYMNKDNNPLPKFWYFPNDKKAVMVMAGDDHATANGTQSLFDYMLANSPTGCSIANWECLRATSWMYTSGPMTNTQAATYEGQGFDIGVHVSTGCSDYTPASLEQAFTDDLAAFRAKYSSLPAQTGSRTHCIAWSDYASTPLVESAHGIRMDLNYYYWPGSWVQNRPGYMTGSGMAMRYAKADGTMIDVYQEPSHLVNESGQNFPAAINLQLDRALGPEGYYGAIGTHFDYSDTFGNQLVEAAIAHNIPVVSVQQMLDWTDGRNASSFGTPSWQGSTLSFSASVDAKVGSMLRGMLPLSSVKGTLTDLTKDGVSVSYTTETIKGIQYAIYPVSTGNYAAVYTPDTTAPTVTALTPTSGATGVDVTTNVSATFSEPLDASSVTASAIELRTASGTLVPASLSYDSATNTVILHLTSSLTSNTTYTVTVYGATGITDLAGNPLASDTAWSFTTGVTRLSLWAPASQTVGTATSDTSKVELGTQFTSTIAGSVSGITYYKSANDATQHTVTLWDSAGSVLGTATTANETASGWQTATFASPISITPNMTYTASYTAPAGQYSYSAGTLVSGFSNGSLSVLANGGVYSYGTGVPTGSFNGTNYWVDVIFNP